jgi:uncharacterized delta-60 repeat protein
MGTQRTATAVDVIRHTCNGREINGRRSIQGAIFEALEMRLLYSATMMDLSAAPELPHAGDHAPLSSEVVHGGDFDQSFGAGGKVVVDVFGPDSAQTVVVQSDGKILVAGQSGVRGDVDPPMSADVSVVRLNSDGSLDTTFGNDGKVLLESRGWSGHDATVPMLVMGDGKLLVGGSGMHRLNPDGSLDMTFGVNGATTTTAYVSSMVVMPDGHIMASTGTTLTRFNDDGTLDTTFGMNGVLTPSVDSAQRVSVQDMSVQLDGKLLVLANARMVGATSNVMMLMRFNADGTLDSSLGGSGQSVVALPEHMTAEGVSLRLLDDGEFLVAGNGHYRDDHSSYAGTLLVRFSRNGHLDQSFGDHGVMFDRNSMDNMVRGVAVQSDGKILVSGNGDSAISLYRYNADGSRDASFGSNGRFETRMENNPDWCESATGVALQPNGQIVLLGQIDLSAFTVDDPTSVFAASDLFVMRLTGDSGPLVITDNGNADPAPSPNPDPDPQPAPAPSPHVHQDPAPVLPHEHVTPDDAPVVTHVIGSSQLAPVFHDVPTAPSIGHELFGAQSDDLLFDALAA